MSTTYVATSIGVIADFDHGEGWMTIQWPDEQYGNEGLRFDIDGHCSRNMPIRSGQGPPDFVELQRGYLIIRFESDLAERLELDEDIKVEFDLDEEEFRAVQRFVEHLGGAATN